MQYQSKRKESVSVNMTPEKLNVIRIHANKMYRSVSETIRMIVEEYITQNKLEERYANELQN